MYYKFWRNIMTKVVIKLGALLTLAFIFTGEVNAAAIYSAPPLCQSGSPGPGQAFVYTAQNYGGICYLLQIDNSGDSWSSWDATTGFPNDQMQSVWVGPNVTLVLFWNTFNA